MLWQINKSPQMLQQCCVNAVRIMICDHSTHEWIQHFSRVHSQKQAQDHEEISALDIAEAIKEMHARKRYKRLFAFFETCQASTMFARVVSPGAFMLAASKKGTYLSYHAAHASIIASIPYGIGTCTNTHWPPNDYHATLHSCFMKVCTHLY